MNLFLGISGLLVIVGFVMPTAAHPVTFTRVQYTQHLLGGELSCRTLESDGVYYSLEEHVLVALLRGYVLDRYLSQDSRYPERGECPRIQWMKWQQVEEVTLEITSVDDRRIIVIWGYELSPETAVSLLQSEGFHVELRGNTIYATR